MAVISWAQTPQQFFKINAKAAVQRPDVKWSKYNGKRALTPSTLLGNESVTLILKSYAYQELNYGTDEEPDYQLEPAPMERTTESWTITTIDAANNTVGITGIMGGSETVTGTISTTPGESGYTLTIPCQQKAAVTEYGDVYLFNYTGKDVLVGTISDDGIRFDDMWYTAFIDGEYAGYVYKSLYQSMAVLPNGKMATDNYNPREGSYQTQENDVAIDMNPANFTATIWNFNDFHVAIDVLLKDGKKFIIEPQVVESDILGIETYYTTSINYTTEPIKITGTGTDNTLTFATQWTCYAPYTGYAYGTINPSTITYDASFVYPVLEEVPATPITPEVVFFTHWFEETGSASVKVNIYPTDTRGNDMITRLLTYQLYTKDASGNPVTLGNPIEYDDMSYGDAETKTVPLDAQAKGLKVIGVKSIYTAKGETNESGISWFEIPQLITVPDGLEAKEYPTLSEAHDASYNNYTSERVSKVAIDGNNIYIQGILPQSPYGWAKGTIRGNTVTIPSMQCQGSSKDSYVWLTGLNYETQELKNIVFEYNPDEDIYVTEDMIIANISTEEVNILPPYLAGMTIGKETIPEAVQLPEGAEVKEYPFVGYFVESGKYPIEFESTVNVAVVDDHIYVQGLNEWVPEAWVMGTKTSDGNIVFPTGQNFGVDETKDLDGNVFYSRQFFFVGADIETGKIADVIMTYNAENDYYELQSELMVNNRKSTLDIVKWYLHGSTIGLKEETNLPPLVTVEAPQDLETGVWSLSANEVISGTASGESALTKIRKDLCYAGFYTADGADGTDFYIQGLCPERPEIWVKAPLKDGKVVIPASTYLGINYLPVSDTYDYIPVQLFFTAADLTTIDNTLTDVVFTYDEQAGTLTSDQNIFINGDRRKLAYLHSYAGMTITLIPDVAATPADPEIPAEGGLDVVDTWSPKIHAIIKPVDVDGKELLTEKLAYSVWVEKDGNEQPLVFEDQYYWGLDDDVTEIPYEFTNWDITAAGETITLYQDADEIKTWRKIGIQSIYYGGGERRVSNIVWAENPSYDASTAITDVVKRTMPDGQYFDLQGRRVDTPKKGLYIVNGKKVMVK